MTGNLRPGELVERPNGKLYRARRVVAYPVGEEADSVLVLGTHDPARAQALADQVAENIAGAGFTATGPHPGWWRDGYEHGHRAWVHDEVTGRAGLWYADIVEGAPQ